MCIFAPFCGKENPRNKRKQTKTNHPKSCARHGFRVFIMKKLVLSALVMSALFFASCGGTQEYKDAKKVLDDYEKAISKAKGCDDLKSARKDFYKAAGELSGKEYGNKEKMTGKENDKLTIKNAEVQVEYDKKCRKLECEECKEYWEKK